MISNWGGLGDMLARLPAIRYCVNKYDHMTLHVYWQDYVLDIVKFLLPETDRLKHFKLSEATLYYKGATIDFTPNRLTSLRLHLTQHAFLILMDQLAPNEKDMQYPLAMKAPAPRIPEQSIIFTVAHTAKTREWPAKEINELAQRARSAGYTPVLLGTTKPLNTGSATIQAKLDDEIDRSVFLDLMNKTTLIEALGVIQQARAVVGVDNGLIHLAHCTDRPIVAGYTSVESKVRVPIREAGVTEVIEAPVYCYGCQSKTNFIDFDFRRCIYADYACTLTMTAQQFADRLKVFGVEI